MEELEEGDGNGELVASSDCDGLKEELADRENDWDGVTLSVGEVDDEREVDPVREEQRDREGLLDGDVDGDVLLEDTVLADGMGDLEAEKHPDEDCD